MNLLKDNVTKMYYIFLSSAIGSTIVTTIYTTVDLICVGHYSGPVASAAISCINPLWSVMIAPGVLSGVGGSVMYANRKATANMGEANQFFTLSFIISLIFSLIICFSYIVFPVPLLRFFGAEETVLAHGVAYMRSVAIVSPTFTMCATLSSFLRNDGEAAVPTVATVVGGCVNIVLDILFVFDFGLGLGTFGAGLATSIGQLMAFSVILFHFFRKKCTIRFALPRKAIQKTAKIFSVGLAAFFLDISFGVTTATYNKVIVAGLGLSELAIYGALACILAMFYSIMTACGVALQPISASNFAAANPKRVKKALSLSLVSVSVMGALFFCFSQIFPSEILMLYMSVDETVMSVGPAIVRRYTSGVLVAGISIVLSYYLQSILKQTASLVISLLRGIFLPVILLLLLPLISYDAIWWSIPISEVLTLIACIAYMLIEKKKTVQILEE